MIVSLETPTGIKEGPQECARALDDNVAAHLLHLAPLDPMIQDILLEEVEQCFTQEDNDKLQVIPDKSEIKKMLDSCRAHAAPSTDYITAFFCLLQQMWHIIGDSVTEVIQSIFQGTKPSNCQRTSLMVFGNTPGKKAKSLKISDRRKLTLLNVDLIVMTGIEAARIRATMCCTISPLQLVSGGEKRISHGVAMARDAINAAGNDNKKGGILDRDLMGGFCNMVTSWCYKVMYTKGVSQEVINR